MRKHHFLPDYLTMPSCPTQESISVNAALIDLSRNPAENLARLIWVSADDDVANHAMIVENIPDLGIVCFRGSTGTHSVSFRTTSDFSRALVHGYGFWERQVAEARKAPRNTFTIQPSAPSVTDGRRFADYTRALKLVADLAVELDRLQRAERGQA